MEIAVIPFSPDLHTGAYALWQRCAGIGMSDADSAENIRPYLQRNPGMSFVALDNNIIVGTILCGHDGRRGYIHHLAVDSGYRLRGIARRLVEKSLSALGAHGIQKCHLFIMTDNGPGMRFWETIGWTFRSDLGIMSVNIEPSAASRPPADSARPNRPPGKSSMAVIDLSHPITADMPVYPGTAPPVIEISGTIEKEGFLEKKLTLFSHTGTHADAPAHVIEGAPNLDELPAARFMGRAFLLRLPPNGRKTIARASLQPFETAIAGSEFLLFHTGWCEIWGTEDYFSGYPVLTPEAARWLNRFSLKGVGFDTISADPPDAGDLTIHRILLGNGSVIIENLANLHALPAGHFRFSCFPMPIQQADGAPVRAVAVFNGEDSLCR